MTSIVLHRARAVLTVGGPAIVDGAVAVDGGRILAVGSHDAVAARLADRPFRRREWNGTLTPGLVNAHTHLQYTSMAEVGQHVYTGFEDWAAAFGVEYTAPHDWAASAAEGARLSLAHGTTAVAEIVTDPEAGGAVHEAGLHGVVYWEVFGWKTPIWHRDGRERVLAELRALPTPPATGISPHAIYSLDTEALRQLALLAAEHGIRQHIHAAESASEDEFARTGTGLLADRWREMGHSDLELLAGGGSGLGAIAYLDALGALTSTTHLAHGIYVDADDRAVLRARNVSVALCPRSNAVIGLESPPVADYLREGSPIAVGTDSLSSSPSLNVWDDVAALYRIARAQGYGGGDLHARLLHAATRGGAVALGMDDTGTLAPGARADLAVFPVDATDPRDALAELVEVGAPAALATIVGGEQRGQVPAT